MFENRPTDLTKIARAIAVGVALAVAIVFGARWYVAYDLSQGEKPDWMMEHRQGETPHFDGPDLSPEELNRLLH